MMMVEFQMEIVSQFGDYILLEANLITMMVNKLDSKMTLLRSRDTPNLECSCNKILTSKSALMAEQMEIQQLFDGIRASINKVTNLISSIPVERNSTPANIDTYIDEVVAEFNAANQDEKLNIIMTQAL